MDDLHRWMKGARGPTGRGGATATFAFLLALLPCLPTAAGGWQQPPQEVLDVLHAPRLPWVWTAPGGRHLLLADPVSYPDLAELAGPMHELAGMRVDPVVNGFHGNRGAVSPRLLRVEDGAEVPLALPDGTQLLGVSWTVDGERFALEVEHADHLGLWVGSVDGELREIGGVALNPLLGSAVQWMPDQRRLLVRRVPPPGAAPAPPPIPAGPAILEGSGASARSTYEARNLLSTAHDDELFGYYATSELVVVDPGRGKVDVLGAPALYASADMSPDGKYLLVERLTGELSHEVSWWRFPSELEVWTKKGKLVATVHRYPLLDQVPVHGVHLGPRSVSWRPTAPHTLFWVEALDGGDPMAEVPHRDRLMRLKAPFDGEPAEVYRAEHRIRSWRYGWTEDGPLALTERERIKRWRYTWLVDVDTGNAELWYDLNEKDRYNSPGSPIHHQLPSGEWVLRQRGDAVYFQGSGGTDEGDRPFLDLRSLESGQVTRLFRCDPERYEYIVDFGAEEDSFVLRSESAADVPNYHLLTLGDEVGAEDGEATRAHDRRPITAFEDPTPQLREIEKRIVRYERDDGVPLSFTLYLPPGHPEGEPLPTVLYAYPSEYSDASTAGQVRGSAQRFDRFGGSSHRFFLLQGYAVLDRTAMPMIGDPENTYDTFVPQLVADAEAAVAKAVELGVADPERIGVVGHSHGGLMVANLLAHTDLFAAGIARSGSYNKTVQPFGFQSERRSLFEARDVYVALSPTFFADQIDEPMLLIHGAEDANPGTRTHQSEVLFEAVRGSGGTTRLVLLPHEDHGYRARQSIEHVLWEQLRWFDEHVRGAE